MQVMEEYYEKVHALEVVLDHIHAFVELSIKDSVWNKIRVIKPYKS